MGRRLKGALAGREGRGTASSPRRLTTTKSATGRPIPSFSAIAEAVDKAVDPLNVPARDRVRIFEPEHGEVIRGSNIAGVKGSQRNISQDGPKCAMRPPRRFAVLFQRDDAVTLGF